MTFHLLQFNIILLWLTILAQNVLSLAKKEKACLRNFPLDLVSVKLLIIFSIAFYSGCVVSLLTCIYSAHILVCIYAILRCQQLRLFDFKKRPADCSQHVVLPKALTTYNMFILEQGILRDFAPEFTRFTDSTDVTKV